MEDYSPEIQVALKIYLKGLLPFVNKCFEDVYGNNSIKKIKEIYYNGTGFAIKSREGKIRWDPYKISKFILINECRKFFTNYFETSDYKFIELILKTRNYASHPEFDGETEYNNISLERANNFLDSIVYILNKVNATLDLINQLNEIKLKLYPEHDKDNYDFIDIVTNISDILKEEELRIPLGLKFSKNISTKIYGPPGTGKTSKLINYVIFALKQKIRPENIGFITFSNNAAQIAINRILEEFKGLGSINFPNFCTMHSLATRIGQFSTKELCQEVHFKEFDENIKTWTEWKTKGDPSSSVVRFEHPVLNELSLSISEMREADYTFPNNENWQNEKLFEVLGKYFDEKINYTNLEIYAKKYIDYFFDYKSSKNLINFDDVITQVVNDEFSKDKLPTFELLIIDEAQDLSKHLWEFAKKLIPLSGACYIAGDDDQAIMTGIGAHPKSFIDINCSNDDIILNNSFRVPKVVRTYMDDGIMPIIKQIPNRINKDWIPSNKQGYVHAVFENKSFIANETFERKNTFKQNVLVKDILDKIRKDWLNKSKVPDWLVMSPTKASGEKFSEFLKNLSIPHFYRNKPVLDASPEENNINVQTIHLSKGAEAENTAIVFLGFNDVKLIVNDPRLAYVALTRTKKTMYPLVTSKGYLPVRYDDNNMLINKFDKIFHKTLYFYAD